jgi:hypothetical protein
MVSLDKNSALMQFSSEATATIVAALITALPTGAIAYAAFCISKNQSTFDIKKAQREIFIEYNRQFDKLNDELNNIIEGHIHNNTNAADAIIQDYLNLCSEEYLMKIEGFISDKVWRNWKTGIVFYLQYESVRKVFRREKLRAHASYYGLFDVLNSIDEPGIA